MLALTFATSAGPAQGRVWQEHTGEVRARIDAPDAAAAHDRLRSLLGLDVDHRPFLELARTDRLLAPLRSRLAGARPVALSSPEHALVRAVTGQLIRSGEALRIERRIVREVSPPLGELRAPVTARGLRSVHPARFERAGLSPARAVLLARAASLPWQTMELEPSARVEARIRQVRGLGPWSAGVIMVGGLGRFEQAQVGDLGLIRLCSALLGRPAEVEDTAVVLEPYGEWRAFAALWMLHHPLAGRRTAVRRGRPGAARPPARARPRPPV